MEFQFQLAGRLGIDGKNANHADHQSSKDRSINKYPFLVNGAVRLRGQEKRNTHLR